MNRFQPGRQNPYYWCLTQLLGLNHKELNEYTINGVSSGISRRTLSALNKVQKTGPKTNRQLIEILCNARDKYGDMISYPGQSHSAYDELRRSVLIVIAQHVEQFDTKPLSRTSNLEKRLRDRLSSMPIRRSSILADMISLGYLSSSTRRTARRIGVIEEGDPLTWRIRAG